MKVILKIVILILFSVVAVAFTSALWPQYEDQFFEFGLLGKEKTADEYYPNGNSTLMLNSQVNWYIYVHNHMGEARNVTVRVKLINSTMQSSNDSENKPSPFVPITEFPFSLPINETLLLPFSWSISGFAAQSDSIILTSLMINDQTIQVDIPSQDSLFNFVFELWVYDPLLLDYTFGWENGVDFYSASLNIGFKVNSIAN